MNKGEIETPQSVREYLSQIGSIKTPAKAAAARENAIKAGAARRHPSSCTCGREEVIDPFGHKANCHIYQSEKQRERRAKRKEEEAGV